MGGYDYQAFTDKGMTDIEMKMGLDGMTTLRTREPIHINHLLRVISGLNKQFNTGLCPIIPPEPVEMELCSS